MAVGRAFVVVLALYLSIFMRGHSFVLAYGCVRYVVCIEAHSHEITPMHRIARCVWFAC